MTADALLDSNVLIALVAEAHEHHIASLELFAGNPFPEFAIAAHISKGKCNCNASHGAPPGQI